MEDADFERFDLILAMDWDNLALLEVRCPPGQQRKLRRLTEFCLTHDSPTVPDPYYGSDRDFEAVYRLCEAASEALLRRWA